MLSDFDIIKICTGYKYDGHIIEHFPMICRKLTSPEYVEMKGWNSDISDITKNEKSLKNLNEYIRFIEKETGIPVTIVSLGPDRKQIIFR